MTIWSPWDFKKYGGAFTVSSSTVDRLQPGTDVEFFRHDADVFICDAETGAELALPAAVLTLEPLGPGRWRLLHARRMLLEVEPTPPDFRERDFSPPRGYAFLTKFVRPRKPWPPPPERVTLPELISSH